MVRRIANQVHQQAARLMRSDYIKHEPAWYRAVLDHPPLPLPPRAPPARPHNDGPRPGTIQEPRDARPRTPRPLPVYYLEDDVRRQFFRDHPFEAFRERSLVEEGVVEDEHPIRGKAWIRLSQRGKNPTPEECVLFRPPARPREGADVVPPQHGPLRGKPARRARRAALEGVRGRRRAVPRAPVRGAAREHRRRARGRVLRRAVRAGRDRAPVRGRGARARELGPHRRARPGRARGPQALAGDRRAPRARLWRRVQRRARVRAAVEGGRPPELRARAHRARRQRAAGRDYGGAGVYKLRVFRDGCTVTAALMVSRLSSRGRILIYLCNAFYNALLTHPGLSCMLSLSGYP